MKRFFILFLLVLLCPFYIKAASWSYQAEGLGMTLLLGNFTLDEDNQNYTATLTTRSKGILSLFVDSQTKFYAHGIKKGDYLPTESYMINMKKKQIRKRVVDFSVREVLDYQSALLNLLNQEKPHTVVYLLSDGKRVLQATFLYEGKEELDDVYSITVEILSGKKTGWFMEQMAKGDSPLRLFLSYDPDTNRKILKKAVLKTGVLGEIVIYLVKGEE